MKSSTIIALCLLSLSAANAFHFPSQRFGSRFNHPHFRQPNLFDQYPSHRHAAQPTREQQQRQQQQQLEQLKHSAQQLSHQHHELEAYQNRIAKGMSELEAQYTEHQSYYQAALDELHPRSQRYAHVYRQAQAKLNQIQAQYRRYKQELDNTKAKLVGLAQQLQRVEQDKQHVEHKLLVSQDLHGRTQEPDATEQSHQQQSHQQQSHQQHQEQHQQQQRPQPPLQPLPPQDPQELKHGAAPPSAGTPRVFKKTIRKGGQTQSASRPDIRSGIEIDEHGLPWQAGGIWTGVPDEASDKAGHRGAPLSDHDEHVMYMKELREYLYR
jgi:DNA polymerase III alpha subunit (gram-positive type)